MIIGRLNPAQLTKISLTASDRNYVITFSRGSLASDKRGSSLAVKLGTAIGTKYKSPIH